MSRLIKLKLVLILLVFMKILAKAISKSNNDIKLSFKVQSGSTVYTPGYFGISYYSNTACNGAVSSTLSQFTPNGICTASSTAGYTTQLVDPSKLLF